VSNAGEDEVGFEELYAKAGEDLEAVPWALLAAHPALVSWLDGQPAAGGKTALVVGCGYGDDAEELGGRGYRVMAFDIAPTAIARCRERFPGSGVGYRVADLFALPPGWHAGFDLVVEIRTLQSLPVDERGAAVRAIAQTVRPGGRLWLRCLGRADDAPLAERPWPVSRLELNGFATAGLDELEFREELLPAGRGRAFTVVYQRGSDAGR
jgi:SAM-dependent methyltransferase